MRRSVEFIEGGRVHLCAVPFTLVLLFTLFFYLFYLLLFPFTLKKFIDGGTRASLRSALSIQLHKYQIYEFFYWTYDISDI